MTIYYTSNQKELMIVLAKVVHGDTVIYDEMLPHKSTRQKVDEKLKENNKT